MRWYNPAYNPLRREYWFGQTDMRPASVWRILFGLILLKDAWYHVALGPIFYSDAGIVPRSALWGGLARPYRFSLMDALGAPWMVEAFFLLWIAVLVCFTVGYRTRLAAILNFVLIISIHERNIYVLNGADTVIRAISFWTMFLPLGEYYSLDALRRRGMRYLRTRDLRDLRAEDAPRTGYALPLRMAQLQIALIYVFTAWLKLPGFAWREGTAIYYALQIKSLTLPTGDWILAHSPLWLMRLLNYQTLFTEWTFFLFNFLPFGQPALRIIALATGALLHSGIAGLMSIGNFSPVMIASYLLFFEPGWIAWIGDRLRRTRTPSTLPLLAGPNPLWLLISATRADAVQIDARERIAATSADRWWIAGPDGERLTGREAWLRALGHLPLSRLWAWVFRFGLVRRVAWWALRQPRGVIAAPEPDLIPSPYPLPEGGGKPVFPPPAGEGQGGGLASEVSHGPLPMRRPLTVWRVALMALAGVTVGGALWWALGQAPLGVPQGSFATVWTAIRAALALIGAAFAVAGAAWNLDRASPPRAVGRTALAVFMTLLMSTLIWWNLTTVRRGDRPIIASVPEVPRAAVQTLGLWQAWDMFSPYPSTIDGWIVIPGRFEDGTTFDLRTGQPVSTEFVRWYAGPSVRWKKYESNLSRDAYRALFEAWGGYYCDLYNTVEGRPVGERLATLEIHYYSVRSHAPGEPENPLEDEELWRHWCFPEYEY